MCYVAASHKIIISVCLERINYYNEAKSHRAAQSKQQTLIGEYRQQSYHHNRKPLITLRCRGDLLALIFKSCICLLLTIIIASCHAFPLHFKSFSHVLRVFFVWFFSSSSCFLYWFNLSNVIHSYEMSHPLYSIFCWSYFLCLINVTFRIFGRNFISVTCTLCSILFVVVQFLAAYVSDKVIQVSLHEKKQLLLKKVKILA